ncbi:hypothetical protein [Peribacillus butanolivorans]
MIKDNTEIIIQKITDKLYTLDLPQLMTIQKGVEALSVPSHERLHNLGRLIEINWNE